MPRPDLHLWQKICARCRAAQGQHGAPQTVIAEASVGMSARPSGRIVSAQAPSGLFTYKLLSAPYIGYLGARGTFPGYLLWPTFFLHRLLALLLTSHSYGAVRRKWLENYQNTFPLAPQRSSRKSIYRHFRDYIRIGGYPTGTTRMRLPDPQRPFAYLG